jgi:hypothetical protein
MWARVKGKTENAAAAAAERDDDDREPGSRADSGRRDRLPEAGPLFPGHEPFSL